MNLCVCVFLFLLGVVDLFMHSYKLVHEVE